MFYWSSCCGETGSVASLKSWDTGWIPGLAQWVEYQVLCSADNWTGKSICHGVVKKEKKRKKYVNIYIYISIYMFYLNP